MNIEQVRVRMAQREKELRTSPSPADVQSGAVLNALVYDLTDPDITSSQWRNATAVALPPDMSVKELIFRFTPHKVSTQASAALSRGVIALSRLDIKDRWPALLKKDELAKERKAYEDAYIRVREKLLKGNMRSMKFCGWMRRWMGCKRESTPKFRPNGAFVPWPTSLWRICGKQRECSTRIRSITREKSWPTPKTTTRPTSKNWWRS